MYCHFTKKYMKMQKTATITIYFNFSKALDKVPHLRSFRKKNNHGVNIGESFEVDAGVALWLAAEDSSNWGKSDCAQVIIVVLHVVSPRSIIINQLHQWSSPRYDKWHQHECCHTIGRLIISDNYTVVLHEEPCRQPHEWFTTGMVLLDIHKCSFLSVKKNYRNHENYTSTN